jgi:acyl-CoA synthetase (AMP-forming)/AMP-acid ligase II/aryl carrier-like protein
VDDVTKPTGDVPSWQQESPKPRSAGYSSIYRLIEARAKQTADAVAIGAPGRVPLTYNGLRIQVERTVETLNTMGVGHEHRVAIVLPNGPELAVAFLAVASGATSALLNPTYSAREFDFCLSDLKARAVIVQSGMDLPARSAARILGIPLIELSPVPEAEAGRFTLRGARRFQRGHEGPAQPDDVALVLHTSGTTSRPKIVPLTQTNLCISAQNIAVALELTNSDRCLNVMPLFHVHGLIGAVLASLASGGSVVCAPGFDASRFLAWLGECRPTWYSAVPTMHQSILESGASSRGIIASSALRFIRSSSAALPLNVAAELESAFNAPVIESYGMTEASHQITSNPLPPRERKHGSVGVAAGPEVAIMGEAGNLLSAGEAGEVVIRGANVMQGYENDPAANENAFVNGWLRTGDQGVLDADGYLSITARIKEIINRGGEKIAPREVDEALMGHPAVSQAVTFAVPHATLGEDVVAAVVLRQEASVAEKEIRKFAFSRLEDHKVPSQVVIVDQIPKGPTGKLQRLGLAQKLALELKAEFGAPRSPVEDALAQMWAGVLGVERVGIYDNFFALGGDSLRAIRLVARVRVAFQVELSLATVFREPTIAEQGAVIEEMLLTDIEALSEGEARRLVE